ncbi:MAG: AMP-binding protein [Pseudomonadales bacterium]|nr:AMP-binding protein [Pseudomonadales bacterium]
MSLIIEKLLSHCEHRPNSIAIDDSVQRLTFKELYEWVENFSQYLTDLCVKTIGFQLDNGLSWVVFDLAAMKAGINIVPIPSFFSQQQREHIIQTARIDVLILDTDIKLNDAWQKIENPGIAQMKDLKNPFTTYSREVLDPIEYSNTKITFTSGSTGSPKGVCLANATVESVAVSIDKALFSLELNSHLSVLPLATLLENIAGVYAPLIRGMCVHVPSLSLVGLVGSNLDVEKFSKMINQVNPNSIILVPQLLTALVTLKQFDLITVDNFQMIAVGGGRVSQHLLESAQDMGLPVCQGYGLSECCSVLTLNTSGKTKPNSVGKILPHANVRINSEGEIEANGSNMLGYLGDDVSFGEWYPTGDLGSIDDEGFVYITGRKKNVFITSFGRNVNPEWVESALTQQAAISQAFIFGESKSHNLALIWLRFPQSESEIEQMVNSANAELPDYARASAFIVVDENLSNDLVTPNGRLKRDLVLARFQDLIDGHYSVHGKEARNKEEQKESSALTFS